MIIIITIIIILINSLFLFNVKVFINDKAQNNGNINKKENVSNKNNDKHRKLNFPNLPFRIRRNNYQKTKMLWHGRKNSCGTWLLLEDKKANM